jgi:hypothetical protein
VADDAHIEYRWKQEVVYWEGDRGFIFDGEWGVEPMVTYVPDDESWDILVPEWLRGRRKEVVARLEDEEGYVVNDDPTFWPGAWREVRRSGSAGDP